MVICLIASIIFQVSSFKFQDLGAGVTRDEGEDTEGKLSMKYDYV